MNKYTNYMKIKLHKHKAVNVQGGAAAQPNQITSPWTKLLFILMKNCAWDGKNLCCGVLGSREPHDPYIQGVENYSQMGVALRKNYPFTVNIFQALRNYYS